MLITRKNVEFAKRIFYDRLGDEYVYGGTWSPGDVHEGCDCSGEVTDELAAVVFGTAMTWGREGLSTESYRYKPYGPFTVGPFQLVHVNSPGLIPANAAVKIALHHQGDGGPDSHMWCEVDGVRMETNGSDGTCTAPVAKAVDDGYANDWWYLPGPIEEDGTPLTQPPAPRAAPEDTLFADVSEFQSYVNDTYPYRVISIRSNDGTYQDHKFAENYAWCKRAADDGRLDMFIVYFYWHPNWQDSVGTHQAMILANGGVHPKMVSMIDLERGGNPAGDFSDLLNQTDEALSNWLGDPRRVIAYGNTSDLKGMWSNCREDQLIIASYGSNPDYPGKFAHQYTDGQGYGGGLPEGCPPFGNCDMNSADGFSPSQLAAWCGISSTTSSGGFLDALTPEQQQEIYTKITTVWGSRSPFRHWGEGPVDDITGIELNEDANEHVQLIIKLAEYGDPGALSLLEEVANGDLAVEPKRAADKALARRVLDRLNVQVTAPIAAPIATLVEPVAAPAAPITALVAPAAPVAALASALPAALAGIDWVSVIANVGKLLNGATTNA